MKRNNHMNAMEILPPELVKEIQKYVQGQSLYIPKAIKAPWGSNSGIKEELQKRNLEIRKLHECGTGITELAELFCLSEDRIRAILYTAHVF
jgi:Mor family transcriptional regulator